jgi:ABC-type Mn2+/Zn2+ transport system permease subunit
VLVPFSYAFAQRGVLEVVLLSLGAGLLGTWIVARGLAFYSHAVAAAAFPGLVLAAGVGFAPMLGALVTAAAFALGLSRERRSHDVATALALVGCLCVGVVLASDVFHSGGDVDTLLFGSLFALHDADLLLAAGVAAVALAASFALGPRWLAAGFDPDARRSPVFEVALLALVAVAAVAALAAVGSLLATALLVVPAVTARMWTRRMLSWQLATVALAALEGTAGVWLSVQTNAPPGATIAVLGGIVFGVSCMF